MDDDPLQLIEDCEHREKHALLAAFRYDPETGTFTRAVDMHRGRWRAGTIAGTLSRRHGYVSLHFGSKVWRANRLAWLFVHGSFPPSGLHVDHINGNKTDNRIANLRLATPGENSQNLHCATARSSSGFLGAVPARGNRWAAQIGIGGRTIHLGTFRTAEEAHAAYLRRKATLHPFGPNAHP